jgi:hypothetical protein
MVNSKARTKIEMKAACCTMMLLFSLMYPRGIMISNTNTIPGENMKTSSQRGLIKIIIKHK